MKKMSQIWKTKGGFTSLSVVASSVLLLSIVGCGGGGGSNARTLPTPGPTNLPSVDPPPTQAPTTVPTGPTDPTSCDANTYTPNYIPGLLAGADGPGTTTTGRLLHWKAFAIRIYFKPDAENTPARKTLVVNGFNQWVTGTNNRVRWVETNDINVADSVITFSTYDPNKTGSIVGLTYSGNLPGSTELVSYYQDVNQPAGMRSGDMIVGFTGDGPYDQSTAAHEFGHLLGLGGHSPDINDIMYYTGKLSLLVTTPDINSLRTAYCDNFNQGGAKLAKGKPITGPIVRHVYR